MKVGADVCANGSFEGVIEFCELNGFVLLFWLDVWEFGNAANGSYVFESSWELLLLLNGLVAAVDEFLLLNGLVAADGLLNGLVDDGGVGLSNGLGECLLLNGLFDDGGVALNGLLDDGGGVLLNGLLDDWGGGLSNGLAGGLTNGLADDGAGGLSNGLGGLSNGLADDGAGGLSNGLGGWTVDWLNGFVDWPCWPNGFVELPNGFPDDWGDGCELLCEKISKLVVGVFFRGSWSCELLLLYWKLLELLFLLTGLDCFHFESTTSGNCLYNSPRTSRAVGLCSGSVSNIYF